jgi:hypothetical protein
MKIIVACRPLDRQRPQNNWKTAITMQRSINSNRGTIFSVQSLPRCYKQDSLCGVSGVESIVRQSQANKNESTEAEDIVWDLSPGNDWRRNSWLRGLSM